MEKKYQIFISSTYTDLIEERKKVSDTILSMYQFPIGMEMFSAADEDQWEIIKDTIDSSDYYILIVGHKYGTVIQNGKEAGISYTQKEYKYAESKGIPILAFLISDSVAVLPKNIEDNTEKKEKLRLFKTEVSTGRTVEWWDNKDDLANKVMNSINKQVTRGKRQGWVRIDAFSIEETQKELVEMSKKIRVLEEENAELKRQVVVRIPKLKLEINKNCNIEIPLYEDDLTFIDVEYLSLSMDNVPLELKEIITQKQLDKYNASIPDINELEEYKRILQFYYRAQNHAIDVNFTVYNVGKLKAKDIRVEIKFPDEIKVYMKNRIADFKVPKKPKKGVNPIEQYYSENNIKYNTSVVMADLYPTARTLVDWDSIRQKDSPNKHQYINDSSISIQMKDLLNSYTWDISDKYCIVPTKKGIFNVECNYMCEEYSEIETQIVKISVV